MSVTNFPFFNLVFPEEQNKTNNNNKTETVREQIQSTVPKVNDSNSEIGRTNAQDENTQKTRKFCFIKLHFNVQFHSFYFDCRSS